MMRKRPIWGRWVLRDCSSCSQEIDLEEEKEELVVAGLWRRVRQHPGDVRKRELAKVFRVNIWLLTDQ